MIYLALIGCGALAGLLAGMLGIGGGLVIVPFLVAMAPALSIAADVLPQTVVATSLASMVPVTFAAAWAHRSAGALDMGWARRFVPGVSVGVVGVTLVFGKISSPLLVIAFGLYALWCGSRMLMSKVPSSLPAAGPCPDPRPCDAGCGTSPHVVATVLGAISAGLGLGGAFITVPYLLGQGLPMRRVLATSSGVSFVVCAEGCLAHLVMAPSGNQISAIHWVAATTIGLAAAAAAPFGAAIARHAPVPLLRRTFGALAVFVALISLGARPAVHYEFIPSLADASGSERHPHTAVP